MKKYQHHKKYRKTFVAFICAAWGWWGILYPGFTFTPDIFRVIDEHGELVDDADPIDALYHLLGHVEKGQIQVKSKLFEKLQESGLLELFGE